MRRKTRPRVVWLPSTNAISISIDERSGVQRFVIATDPAIAPFSTLVEIPVVADGNNDDPLDPATSLSDIENSGYRLRRIVGKIFIGRRQDTDDGSPHTAVVTAGLIVRRTNPETGASLAAASGPFQQDPTSVGNWGDPWIWRRSWWLSNGSSDLAPAGVDIPFSNMECGSVADGPHVDVKCARIVSSEERLFLDINVQLLVGGGLGTIPAEHEVVVDLRCLASMRTSSGNRRNASR